MLMFQLVYRLTTGVTCSIVVVNQPFYLQPVDTRPGRVRMTLEQVEEGNIEDLSVRQLKEVLATNFVDYKGCVEKYELVDRVSRLWGDSNKNKQKG